jgi:hypothetical protein
VEGKYQLQDKKKRSISQREFDLEEEYKETMRRLGDTIDNYELKAVPKPEFITEYENIKNKYSNRKDS